MYVWKISDNYPAQFIGEYDRDNGPDRFVFKQGKALEKMPLEPLCFSFDANVSELCVFHDLGNNAMAPLVSPYISQVLSNMCPKDIQLVPTILSCNDGEINNYLFVVATQKISGLDYERSLYRNVPGTDVIMRMDKAVYFDGCLGIHDIARDNDYLSNLLISDRLFDKLKNLDDIGLIKI